MKKKILRLIPIILLMIMFIVIFKFSNQDGENSESLSRGITNFITQNIKQIQELNDTEKEATLLKVEVVVRKLAHFSLYTIVGILSMIILNTFDFTQKIKVGASFAIGFIYAISDEFHQAFIPDRTPRIFDIGVDSLGIIFGIVIVLLMIKVMRKRDLTQNRKNGKIKVVC